MAENQLLPFANGDTANVIPYADWSGLSVRLTGFQSGIASSQQFNYILGQGGAAGYVIGQFVADFTTDNATINATALYASFKKAIAAFVPGNIADGSIGSLKIANGAITNAKLANDAVTSAKLADNSVGTEHIQSNAVTADEIAAGAVGTSELANGSVTFPKIASSAIATQQQAEAGTATNVLMTPQRVKQAIDSAFESDLPMASATQLGGVKITGNDGITINGSGEVAVDFSQMPTDKFEDLLKSIRVPIWLTRSKNFYCNAETGVDNEEEGRGESESKPWKTLNYALRQITDNYNFSIYDVFLYLAPGTYGDESVDTTSAVQELYAFQGSGQLYITGISPDEAENTTIVNLISTTASNSFAFRNVTVYPVIKSSSAAGYNVLDVQKATVNFYNAFFKLGRVEKYVGDVTRTRQLFYISNYGYVRIYATNGAQPSGITIDYGGTNADLTTISCSSGSVQITADINIVSSNSNENSTFIICDALSSCRLTTSVFDNPGRSPQINITGGVTVMGRRYAVRNNSIIATGGKGQEFFPGTSAGSTSTGGQYS